MDSPVFGQDATSTSIAERHATLHKTALQPERMKIMPKGNPRIGTLAAWHQEDMGAIRELTKWENFYASSGFNLERVRGGNTDPFSGVVLSEFSPRTIDARQLHDEATRIPQNANEESIGAVEESIRRSGLQAYSALTSWLKEENVDVLHVDALGSYPLSLAGAYAVKELALEGYPVVLMNHDFTWDRVYYSRNPLYKRAVGNYLPLKPGLENALHIVTNSSSARQMRLRNYQSGVAVSPNLFPVPAEAPLHIGEFRSAISSKVSDLILLQPTRCVPTKGLHHSVHLASRLSRSLGRQVHVVNSGSIGGGVGKSDTSTQRYADATTGLAERLKVPLHSMNGTLRSFGSPEVGSSGMTMHSAYCGSDIVSFPTMYEGFGNPVVEASLEQRVLFAARYDVLREEFMNAGLQVVTMAPTDQSQLEPNGWGFDIDDDIVPDTAIETLCTYLTDESRYQAVTQHNYELCVRRYADTPENREKYKGPVRDWIRSVLQ